MSVPALYIARTGETPVPCSVRIHDKFEATGALKGGIEGSAQIQNESPRLIFLRDDAPQFLRAKAIVSVEAGEAYRIDHTHPAHDITITAEVTKLSADEADGLPVPA